MKLELKIGMRNIKTAIAVFLCVLISKILRLEYPFYAAIAAIISMENSITNSVKVGKNRMMGTIVGASVGLIFALIQPDNAVLCGLGIVLIIYICNMLNWNKSISIAGIVFMAIMVNMNGKSPVQYSINRIIDTFIGISVAILVNYLVFPHDHSNNILKDIDELSKKIAFSINEIICHGSNTDLRELNKSILDLGKKLDIYINEIRIKKDKNDKTDDIRAKLDLYSDIYEHLKIIQSLQGTCALNTENVERLKRLDYDEFPQNEYSKDDLGIVYNYHISRIIEDLESERE